MTAYGTSGSLMPFSTLSSSPAYQLYPFPATLPVLTNDTWSWYTAYGNGNDAQSILTIFVRLAPPLPA
jgi:hypothetical protein